jgi:hypothetical protein
MSDFPEQPSAFSSFAPIYFSIVQIIPNSVKLNPNSTIWHSG